MRLQKALADAGVASRRASEEWIRAGRVTVNGITATIGMSVGEEDVICVDGAPIGKPQEHITIMLYKPRGVVCTAKDPEGRKTVQAYIGDISERLYNVGRLDLNSEGLLLMTNDGDLAYRMTHPRFGAEKTYYVVCDGELTNDEIGKLQNGVEIGDGLTAPARVDFVRPTATGQTSCQITIHEGRNRQIRRMLEAVGHRTLRLKRERFAGLSLGDLKPGQWRYLTDDELQKVKQELGL